MSREIKLGLLFFIFIFSFLAIGVWLKGNPFTKGYEIEILFPNVHGLSKGSTVEYEGLRCGKVQQLIVSDEHDGILAKVSIENPEVQIYKSDRFLIAPNSTIASEYLVLIEKGLRPAPIYQKGMLLRGEVPPGFEDFLFGAKDALEHINIIMSDVRLMLTKLHKSVEKTNPILEEIHKIGKDGKLERIIANIEKSTSSFNQTAQAINIVFSENEQQINDSIKEFNSVIKQINSKLGQVSEQDIASLKKDLEETMINVKNITSQIETEDIKIIKQTADQARNILEKIQSTDPNNDFSSLLMANIKRIDKISQGLEYNLKRKSLLGALKSRIPLDLEKNNAKRKTRTQNRRVKRSMTF